ncbi:MAG: aminoglycoside phosphotransferase family protein, partial [Acidobacteriota bacterium]
AEMARVVQPDGFAYLALRNRFSLSRSRATPPATVTGLRRVAVITALRRHGFRTLRVYPLVLDQELVTDVLINGGYRSVRNSFRFTERSKELLLRPPLASFLAPAVAIVAHRRPAEPSGLQQLLVETAPHLGELPNATRPLSVERYQISHGKAVVTLRVPGGGRQRFVALMPLREDSSRRQREEIAILRQLHAKQLQVSRCVPKPLSEGRVQTRPFHLQTAIDGIAIDLPFTQMASITRQAAEALTQFHRETRREAVLDGEQLTRLVRDPIRRVVEKLGSESDEPSRRIAERIETAWHGRRVPLVWCHGDYKLENVLFRRHDLKLCGIIDWDLSQPRSLPLLDLVYLVGYNHRIRTGMRIEEFTRNLLLTERLEPFDRELIDAYIAALGLDSATVALLRGLFWIYHLAFRIQLMPGLPRFREELMATLHVTREYYESRGIS